MFENVHLWSTIYYSQVQMYTSAGHYTVQSDVLRFMSVYSWLPDICFPQSEISWRLYECCYGFQVTCEVFTVSLNLNDGKSGSGEILLIYEFNPANNKPGGSVYSV